MLNILSLLIGIVTLVLAAIAFIPPLGAANWLIIPIALVGLALGQLSSSRSGRNLNLIVIVIAMIRLSFFGGII